MGKGKQHSAEYRALVEMLRTLRQNTGLTQEELAKRLGKPQSYVSKIERGARLIDPVELRWWCKALDRDVSQFVKKWCQRLG